LKVGNYPPGVIGNKKYPSKIRFPDRERQDVVQETRIWGYLCRVTGVSILSGVTIEEGGGIFEERPTSDRYSEDLDVVIQRLTVKAPII